jgi:DnaJ-domain-containing protein 1
MTQSLKQLLNTAPTSSMRSEDNFYFHPHIPPRKMSGAKSSYLPASVQPDDILILIDDTVFGGSKEGLVVTENAIYLKVPFESPKSYPLSQIQSVAWDKGVLSTMLYINGIEGVKKPSIMEFVQLISSCIGQHSGHANAQSNNTSSSNFNSSQANEFEECYPLVDILSGLVLQKDKSWTTESVRLVKSLLDDLAETEEQMALLQARMKFKDRPPLDQAFDNLLRVINDPDVKSFVLHAACQIFQLENIDYMTLLMAVMAIGKRLELDEQSIMAVYVNYVDEDEVIQPSQPSEYDEHFEWACTILEIIPHQMNRDTVQQAYRTKIKDFHPDKYQSLPEPIKQMLHEKAQELNKAKEILTQYVGA